MKNWTLRQRILASFAVIIAIMLLMIVAAYSRLVAIEAAATVPAIATYLGAIAAGHAVALLPAGDADAMRRFCERFRPEISFRRIGGR